MSGPPHGQGHGQWHGYPTKDEHIEELDAQVAELHTQLGIRDATIRGLKHELAAAATRLVVLDEYRERHIEDLLAQAHRH